MLAGALWGMVFIVPELLPDFSPVELAVGRYTAYGAISFGLMLPGLRRLLEQWCIGRRCAGRPADSGTILVSRHA